MKPSAVISLLSLSAGIPIGAVEVVLDFEAKAETVVDMPFGLHVPRRTVVTGSFIYETGEATDLNGSPGRGWYQLRGGGGFTATFLDGDSMPHTVTGSATPWLEVENIEVSGGGTIDTFRFWDGDETDTIPGTAAPKAGLMSVDDTVDGDNFLNFAMTDGSGAAFPNDFLPEIYPMTGVTGPIGYPFPHTFVIGDSDGRMLLQLTSLSQRSLEPPRITSSTFSGGRFDIEFTSYDGETYTIEFATTLGSWDQIATGVEATGRSTAFGDTGVVTRLGALPDTAYYRVWKE